MALVGDQVYAAVGKKGLLQISLQNPAKPRLRGEVEIPAHLRLFAEAVNLSQAGDTLLVANSRAGCQIFDISDPGEPRFQSTVSAMGNVTWVGLMHGLAFVQDSGKDVLVMDIADPEKPCLIGTLGVSNAKSVAVVDNKACVTLGGGGVRCMPLPLEMPVVAIPDSREMFLQIPPLSVSGNYMLTVYREGEHAVLNEPLSIVAAEE